MAERMTGRIRTLVTRVDAKVMERGAALRMIRAILTGLEDHSFMVYDLGEDLMNAEKRAADAETKLQSKINELQDAMVRNEQLARDLKNNASTLERIREMLRA